MFADKCGRERRAYRQVCGQKRRNVAVGAAVSSIIGLAFHSAFVGDMNAERFSEFLTQARLLTLTQTKR